MTFGHYVVALIDLLGQAEKLARWDYMPQDAGQRERFIEAVRASYGHVMSWRKQFARTFAMWRPADMPPEILASDPQDAESFKRFQECPIEFMQFSDTIVVYSPITNPHGFLQAHAACAMIITCGALLVAALVAKTVFRGAIEIGMAGLFPQTDLYGPALAKAHSLESRLAQYPRIVVGPRLHQYLQTLAANPNDGKPARANRYLARLALSRVAQDQDSRLVVDYLNKQFMCGTTKPDDWRHMCETAFSFVMSERERFTKEGNRKLAERYQRLAEYFKSRGFSAP